MQPTGTSSSQGMAGSMASTSATSQIDIFEEISRALLDSPFEASILSANGGSHAVKEYSRETSLQSFSCASKETYVYMRCEAGLETPEGVQLLLRVRDGFKLAAQVPVLGVCSWYDDGDSVPAAEWEDLGNISQERPVIITPVVPSRRNVRTIPGSHFTVLVALDISRGAPKACYQAQLMSPRAALKAEEEDLAQLGGQDLIARVKQQPRGDLARNLEFLCEVVSLRLARLGSARHTIEEDMIKETREWLQAAIVDRLQGRHFQERRRQIAKDLYELASSGSPRKRQRVEAQPDLVVPGTALYKDAEGRLRPVQLVSFSDGLYRIWWERRTERSRLRHLDGSQLTPTECRSPATVGTRLLYQATYDEVTVLKLLSEAEELDDDGVPGLQIKFTRSTLRERLQLAPEEG